MITSAERDPDVDRFVDQLFAGADRNFLSSAISREEGRFLCALASRPSVRSTIEVGCANGISSIFICAGLTGKTGVSHTAIDPFQTQAFGGRGVENVRAAGFDCFRILEERSEFALPALLREGARFDLALIDGLHTADQTMVDFYYIDRLLPVGGFVVFDDVNSPAVNKVTRYAATYPNYRLLGAVGPRGRKRRAINAIKSLMRAAAWPLRKLGGEALAREFLDTSLLGSNLLWSLDAYSMVAFEKTGTFDRDTNWFCGI